MYTTRRSLGLMIAVCGVLAGEVFAQGNNNQNNNQNNASGIKVDAQGVVSFALANDSAGVLDKKRREAAATTRLSTQAFAKQFTEKYPELADRSPIFAELQNLIDLAVLAALIQKERLDHKVDWKMTTLLDEQRFLVPTYPTPKQVPSLVNYKRAGSNIVGLVGGGVTIRPQQVLNKLTSPPDSKAPRLDAIRTTAASAKRTDSHPWWWDR